MAIADGKALLDARRNKKWTQLELSAATRVDVSTISRLERGKPTRVRGRTLKALAKALDVAPESLCQEPEAEWDVMKVQLTNAARNALILIAVRYEITVEDIVEVAPLLFFIAAEQCLQERQKRIAEIRAAADALVSLELGIRHLPTNMPIHEDAVSREEESIMAHDLFGNKVVEKACLEHYDHAKQNPFVMFLRDSLARASSSPALAESVEWDPKGWPRYEICLDEIAAIVGNDPEAVRAIVCGVAALHEKPKDIDSSEEMAAWAREEAERVEAMFAPLMEQLKCLKREATNEGLSPPDSSRHHADVAAGNRG